MPRVLFSAQTDVGMKRTHNEDDYLVIEDSHVFLVADGMGGHACGEVASRMACETVQHFYNRTEDDPEATWPYKMDRTRGYEENRLVTGVKLANLRIFETAQKDEAKRGMGTTVVAMRVIDNGVLVAHVGDSRAYMYRNGKLTQLTEDHSLLNDYIKMKKLKPEEIEKFHYKNIISRALGMKESVKVDLLHEASQPGDVFLLCSDGLCGPASDEEIAEIMGSVSDPKAATEQLIERANANGGPDNVTAIVVRVVGTD